MKKYSAPERSFEKYLWAASRKKYIGKKHEGCIFCAIAKKEKGVLAKEVYRNGEFMVLLNVFPYNRGHVEVIPLRHVYSIADLDEGEIARLFSLVAKTTRLLNEAYKPAGINIGINIGEAAGGSIRHLHVQLVPRYKRETGFMEVIADTRVMPETLDQTLAKLKKYRSLLNG